MDGRLAFPKVSVAGAPAVEFCVDLDADDVIAPWLLEHAWIDEPVQRVLLALIEPGSRLLDLGCHLGTFALPASALGARVLAVDASPQHVRQLRVAAGRNGFDRLHIVQAAATDATRPVRFIEQSIHGRISTSPNDDRATLTVPGTTVDALLATQGWDGIDVIKMDIEGSETAALRGMQGLLSTGARPAIVFECNGDALSSLGSSTRELRETLARLGYRLFLIDHLRPGTLVEATADGIQPESASDYLAVTELPPTLSRRWTVEPPMGLDQTVTRLLDQAASVAAGYRRYAAQVIADGPEWLRSHPLVMAARRTLEVDIDAAVRHALEGRPGSAAAEHASAEAPSPSTPPGDLVLLLSDVSLRLPSGEPDRLDDLAGEALLRGASFHVRKGQLLGVLTEDRQASSELLRAIAGLVPNARGDIEVQGRPVLISALGEVLEHGLTVAENMAVLGAFLGAHVQEVMRRTLELAAIGDFEVVLDAPLGDVAADVALRLVLAVTLTCAETPLLLVDELPSLGDGDFSAWVAGRVADRRARGLAVVQVVRDPLQLWPRPDRVLWLADSHVVACGHPESVLDATKRRVLGLRNARPRPVPVAVV